MPLSPPEPRPHCLRCDRPLAMCLCAHVPRLANRVGVHILQHRRERRHPLGTTRLLKIGLDQVRVHVLDPRSRHAASPAVELPIGAGLLYPSPDAADLATLGPEQRPPHLVLIDGTWDQAHRIHRDNPWVHGLPHYKLSPTEASRYRIRTEPRFECLSTVEAVVSALLTLEPDLEGTDALLAAFDAMIDAQIDATEQQRGQRRVRLPRPRPAPTPPPLARADQRLFVVHAEAAPRRGEAAEAMRLSAVDVASGEVFDALILPHTPPDDYELAQIGLPREALATARPLAEVLADFAAFCRRDAAPALTTWSGWTHGLLPELLPEARRILLKAELANRTHQRVPGLEVVVANLGLQVLPVPIPGRAGDRLALACALARHLASGPLP